MIKDVKELIGRKIASAEIIRAEYGRTYDKYLCIVFEDGAKALLCCATSPLNVYSPNPTVEQMQKAPNFFSPDDIADVVRKAEQDKRQAVASQKQRDENQYETLRKKLNKV